MKKMLLTTTVLLASAPAAFAVGIGSGLTTPATPVPEISALEGTAALAVVAAIVLLAWERRRKAA